MREHLFKACEHDLAELIQNGVDPEVEYWDDADMLLECLETRRALFPDLCEKYTMEMEKVEVRVLILKNRKNPTGNK